MSAPRERVGDILELRRAPVELRPEGTYSEVGIRSFGRGVFLKDPVTGASLGSKKVYEVRPGDLLVSNVFAWEGAVAVAGPETEGRIGSHRFMTWVPRRQDVNVEYLANFFISEPGLEMIGRASPGSAGRNRTLGIRNFENLVVPLPNPPEQERIATRLNRMAAVASSAQTSVGERFRVLINPLLVDGEERPLGSFLELARDEFPVERSAHYERAGVLGFGRGLFSHGTLEGSGTKYQKLRRVHAGVVVLSRLKAFEGAVAIAPRSFDGFVVSQEFETFRVLNPDDVEWLDALIRADWFWTSMRGQSTGVGARRERVSADRFTSIKVPVPSRIARERIGRINEIAARTRALSDRRDAMARALLPAARNEEFGQLM